MSNVGNTESPQYPEDFASTFRDLGWVEVPRAENSWKATRSDDRRKARCFRSPQSRRHVYLKVKPGDHASPKRWPIVISPADAGHARRAATSAITFKPGWDHGTMYGRFPTRVHRGRKDIPYGMAFEALGARALRAFLISFDQPETAETSARSEALA